MSSMDYQEWGKQIEEKEEKDRIKREEQQRKWKIESVKRDIEFRKICGEHWYYKKADTYVPVDIRSVPALDRVNSLSVHLGSDGKLSFRQTLVAGYMSPYTVDEYHEKYCEQKSGKWYYKME